MSAPDCESPSFVVHLIGFPAAGKLTVARELADRAERRFVVVDNHHINNVIFGVIHTDGVTPLPPRVWSLVTDVRDAVIKAIGELGPPDWSYIFTNVLVANSPGDAALVDDLRQLAARRGSVFVPVRLHCDPDELLQRIVSPDRVDRRKWVDPVGLVEWLGKNQMIGLEDEHALDVDTTSTSPADVADAILRHIHQIAR